MQGGPAGHVTPSANSWPTRCGLCCGDCRRVKFRQGLGSRVRFEVIVSFGLAALEGRRQTSMIRKGLWNIGAECMGVASRLVGQALRLDWINFLYQQRRIDKLIHQGFGRFVPGSRFPANPRGCALHCDPLDGVALVLKPEPLKGQPAFGGAAGAVHVPGLPRGGHVGGDGEVALVLIGNQVCLQLTAGLVEMHPAGITGIETMDVLRLGLGSCPFAQLRDVRKAEVVEAEDRLAVVGCRRWCRFVHERPPKGEVENLLLPHPAWRAKTSADLGFRARWGTNSADVVTAATATMKPHKPRLIEIHENVLHLQIRVSRGEELTPLQHEVLKAWKASGYTSRMEALTMRPWMRGDAIVFRDVSLGSLSKSHEIRRARRMQ